MARSSRLRPLLALLGGVCLFLGLSGSTCQPLTDSDKDGVINSLDAFPRNAQEQFDSDGDGVGDNSDADDDGDGISDAADGPVIDVALEQKLATLKPDQDTFPLFDGNKVSDLDELGAIAQCCTSPNVGASPPSCTPALTSTACTDALQAVSDQNVRQRIELLVRAGQAVFLFQFDPKSTKDLFPIQTTQPFPLGDTAALGPLGVVLLGNLIGDEQDRGRLGADTDNDGIPDQFELDRDGDGVPDTLDAFPDDPAEAGDNDLDGMGNNRDCNDDGPGGLNTNNGLCVPVLPVVLIDDNADGLVDAACPADQNGDGVVDDLGADPDNDGLVNLTPGQLPFTTCAQLVLDAPLYKDGFSDPVDSDNNDVADFLCPPYIATCDLIPDTLDLDADNDGCPDEAHLGAIPNCPVNGDRFPFDSKESEDTDTDNVGDNGDVCPLDGQDFCVLPQIPLTDALGVCAGAGTTRGLSPGYDLDCDGMTNDLDTDIDGDGTANSLDPRNLANPCKPVAIGLDRFSCDATETADNDLDGIGDNADPDDDNDALSDALECQPQLMVDALFRNALVSADDLVNDTLALFGQSLNTDRCTFTNPRFPDSDLDGLSDGAEWEQLRQFLGCGATERIFDPACPLDLITIADPSSPAINLKRTYPLLDSNSDADRPDGQVIASLSDTPELDGRDPAPFVVGTKDQDSDGDGLLDSQERDPTFFGTNPFDSDSDHDGLPDNFEVVIYYNASGKIVRCGDPAATNKLSRLNVVIRQAAAGCPGCLPARADSICRYDVCNPLNAPSCCQSTNNLQPACATNPMTADCYDASCMPQGTPSLNPNTSDVDGDSLLDGAEVNGFKVAGNFTVRTNPVLSDTDNQGVDTYRESPNPNCQGGLGNAPCALGGGPAVVALAFPDGADNCPIVPNSMQSDADFDGLGEVQTVGTAPLPPPPPPGGAGPWAPPGAPALVTCANAALPGDTCVFPANGCDTQLNLPASAGSDFDGDGIDDSEELSPRSPRIYETNPSLADTDNDGIGDGPDNCPLVANTFQLDADEDGLGDLDATPPASAGCDSNPGSPGGARSLDNGNDSDIDGLTDCREFFGLRRGGFHTALDVADTDGDGVLDGLDNCPCAANASQADVDGDGVGDLCESSFAADCRGAAYNTLAGIAPNCQ